MNQRIIRAGWLVALLALVACDGFDPGSLLPASGSATATIDPALTIITDDGPTLTPILPLVETPVLMCTPPACAPDEGFACPTGDCPGGCGTVCMSPTPITGTIAPSPTEWENLEGWLAALWRGLADPAAVRSALQQSGMQRDLNDWRAADFDGDLRDEWVLVLYDPSMPGVPFGAAGDLWIVNDNGAVFRYYNAPSSDIYNFIAPKIIELVDLTGDGLPELITDAVVCGADTCYDNFRVIGSRDGQLTDLVLAQPTLGEGLDGTPITMPYAETRIEDFDGDGLLEFLVRGGNLGAAGAGVVRPRTEVWGWNGSDVVLEQTILDPTAYRHHVLYEANDRMAAGDLDGALALYEAAINDGALRDDGYGYPPEQIRADISAFAAFRLILIDLLQGNGERANSRLAWLQTTYPASAAAGAAAKLVGEWAGPENGDALCDRIEAGLLAAENPLGVLRDMGYGNPALGEGDFCPDMHVWE